MKILILMRWKNQMKIHTIAILRKDIVIKFMEVGRVNEEVYGKILYPNITRKLNNILGIEMKIGMI